MSIWKNKRRFGKTHSALLLALLATGCQSTAGVLPHDAAGAAPGTQKYEEFIASGDPLPIRSVVDLDGETVDLATPEKRKLVILFATWCKDSNRALKALNRSDLLDDESIEIIAIAREETADVVTAWRDEHGIRIPLATDPDRAIFKQFAAAGVPRLITVGKNNRVIKMNLAEVEDPLSLIEWH
jgi:peroxiredoxin